MTIYQLLHLVLLISLFGCAAGLTCAIIYFVRIRATPPSASAHRTSCANLQHLLAGCARWGCAAALTDMLACAALWLTAPSSLTTTPTTPSSPPFPRTPLLTTLANF